MRSRLANSLALVLPAAHSGLPRVMSSALKRGQGIQARQPSSLPPSRRQATARLPLMANGRFSAAETFR